MNKKILTIFLAIILICTLCITIVACGDKDNNDDTNPNGEQTDTPSTDTPAPDDGGSSPIEPSSSNLLFNLKTDDTYEVVGYTGEPISVVIPSTYNGKAVTSIGDKAFYICLSLSSVTIPNSVTCIGDTAFFSCYRLVEVYNLSSLNITTGFSELNGFVGAYALDVYTSLDTPSKLTTESDGYIIYTNGEEKILINYIGSETELTIPNSISSIHHNAFIVNDTITSIVIPNTVTSIGDFAFCECTNLTNIVVPNSVTSIGDGVFRNCTSLTNIVIPNSITSIGDIAFYECYNLMSITIGSSVTSIGEIAFYDCYKLVEIYNLSSLTIEMGSDSNGYVGYYAWDIYTSLDTPSKLSTDSNGYIIYTNGAKKTLIGYTGC